MDKVIDSMMFGSTALDYAVTYAPRKTLGISVRPDCSVEVKAPVGATLEEIRLHVRRRAAWICRQQCHFRSFGILTPARKYVSGESHLYLGRQYMLRVVQGGRDEVHYRGNILEVDCRCKDDVRALLCAWYRRRADIKLHEYAAPLLERFRRYGVEPTVIALKEMQTRWGSCTPSGRIYLNPRLICAPRICIEYVIIHELCHLVYKNHTKAFYELLKHEMPRWEEWKMKLERTML